MHTNDTSVSLTYLTIGIYQFRLSVDSTAQVGVPGNRLKRNRLTTGRAAKLSYIFHNLKFTEDDINETLAMCTAAKDVGITNQCVSQILAAASCENSSESDELVFSDSRPSTENEGHEQGVSEVRDAEKVSEVGNEELLQTVDDELEDQDEDSEVAETEHSYAVLTVGCLRSYEL